MRPGWPRGLDNLDFVMTAAHASDVEPARAYLAEAAQIILNTAKPMVHIAMDLPDLEAMWELACLSGAGEDQARDKHPTWFNYAEPTSPLRHGRDTCQTAFLRRKGAPPGSIPPAPLAGSTAPLTVAGHVAQGLAEGLFGLVLHQLRNPGAPFIMGMGPAVLDMVTTQSSYNAPEYYLGYLARRGDGSLLRPALLRLRRNLRLPDPGRPGRHGVRGADLSEQPHRGQPEPRRGLP